MSEGGYPDPGDEKGRQERLSLVEKNLEPIQAAYLDGLRDFPEEAIDVVVLLIGALILDDRA